MIQAAGAVRAFRGAFPGASVDWLVRSDFAGLLAHDPDLRKVVAFDRADGLPGLVRLAWALGGADYTHVYDAHNNVRSRIAVWTMRLRRALRALRGRSPGRFAFVRRPKNRAKRWLLFRLGVDLFPMPFRGALSFVEPLAKWGMEPRLPAGPHAFVSDAPDSELEGWRPFVAVAPSAAWETKRWPVDRWKELVRRMSTSRFVILGGPDDSFCSEIAECAPGRALNLAGRRDLAGSLKAISRASLVISADTGLLHAADMMGRPAIALIGPTAFGYPSSPDSLVVEEDLPCKPCSKDGRDRCRNAVDRLCMKRIEVDRVAAAADAKLARARAEARP